MKEAFQFKIPPSKWHEEFRAIDELCLCTRVFHRIQSLEGGTTPTGQDNISAELMQTEEALIKELKEILKRELSKSGYTWELAQTVLQQVAGICRAAPLSRPGDFTFGILYLMQELAIVLNPGKFDDTVVNVAFSVAVLSSEDSRLQLKAFELLMALSKKTGIAVVPIEKVKEYLKNGNLDEETRSRAAKLWEMTWRRSSELEHYTYWKVKWGYETPKLLLVSKVFPLVNVS